MHKKGMNVPYVYKLPSQYGPGIHPIPFQTDIPEKSSRNT